MTLPERIALINSLIKEDRDHTIRDYWETVKEIEWVEQSQVSKDNISSLTGQGLIFRDHSKMIRTPAEKYELPTHERINIKSA